MTWSYPFIYILLEQHGTVSMQGQQRMMATSNDTQREATELWYRQRRQQQQPWRLGKSIPRETPCEQVPSPASLRWLPITGWRPQVRAAMASTGL